MPEETPIGSPQLAHQSRQLREELTHAVEEELDLVGALGQALHNADDTAFEVHTRRLRLVLHTTAKKTTNTKREKEGKLT
jgi:hypothetical protein